MSRLFTHIRHNVIGYLALFVALGGTSYAAFSLPRNSVGTRQLRNGAVTNKKLGRGAVVPANLSHKSIAGYMRAYAQIGPRGRSSRSRPGGSGHGVARPGVSLAGWSRGVSGWRRRVLRWQRH